MGIKKVSNSKYKVDFQFSNGKRIRKTFNRKTEAEEFELELRNENMEIKKKELE